MTEHTKEPCPQCGKIAFVDDKDGPAKRFCEECGYEDYDTPSRTSICVNALAGIDDPEAFMLDARELEQSFEKDPVFDIVRLASNVIQHLKGGE